jgi:hypothetical protein
MDGDFTPSARVIADSITPHGHRLTTFVASMHRWVLAEFNTHRALSRNSASSRAIPVMKTLTLLAEQPVHPLSWPQERKGMQGGDELHPLARATARRIWQGARDAAVTHAEALWELGVHKSVVNRILEPFLPHTVIVSATDWDGFWAQRCSPLAQPEIRAVAEAMHAAHLKSTPVPVNFGGWHLPYISDELVDLGLATARKVSAARCARVSYLTHDGRRDISADLDLYDRLVTADPPHASPLEHVATPSLASTNPGNFTGWMQLRHQVLAR